MAQQTLQFGLKIFADTKDAKTNLDNLKKELVKLQSKQYDPELKLDEDFKRASQAAQELQKHLKFGTDKFGNFNISGFTQSLKNSKNSLTELSSSLLRVGSQGTKSFELLSRQILNAQQPAFTFSKLLQKMGTTLANNIRWQISSAAINAVTGSLQEAWQYTKKMDEALTNIAVVTGKSRQEIQAMSKDLNKMAKELKTTTLDIAKGQLIFYQQGDSAELAAEKARITTMAANVSFNSSQEEMADYLTAIWNSYQVGANELELFVDKLSAVGATTATSMEEIATGMTKVAAAANAVGVTYDQLNATIATISSTTRVSAEQVGTAMKTIYARMGDLKVGKADEDGITYGQVSSTMKQMGIDILDAQGNLRDMGEVVEEVGNKWQTFSKEEQQALVQAIAGKRQYTNLTALFENWDMYLETLETSKNAVGTLQAQQDIWAESWEAASQRVENSSQQLFSNLLNSDFIIKATNSLATFIDFLDRLIKSLGGIGPILLQIGGLLTRVFQTQIVSTFSQKIADLRSLFSWRKDLTESLKAFQEIKNTDAFKNLSTDQQKMISGYVKMAELRSNYLQKEKNLTEEQKLQYQVLLEIYQMHLKNNEEIEKELKNSKEAFSEIGSEKYKKENKKEQYTKEDVEKDKDSISKFTKITGGPEKRRGKLKKEDYALAKNLKQQIASMEETYGANIFGDDEKSAINQVKNLDEKDVYVGTYNKALDELQKKIEEISGQKIPIAIEIESTTIEEEVEQLSDKLSLVNFDDLQGTDLENVKNKLQELGIEAEDVDRAFDAMRVEKIKAMGPEEVQALKTAVASLKGQVDDGLFNKALAGDEASINELILKLKELGMKDNEIEALFKDPLIDGAAATEQDLQDIINKLIEIKALDMEENGGVDSEQVAKEVEKRTDLKRVKNKGEAEAKRIEDNFDESIPTDKLSTTLSGFTKLSGAVMGTVGAIQTFTSTMSTLNNENATTGEKLTALVSGFGTIAMTIATSVIPAFVGMTAAEWAALWPILLIVAAVAAVTAGVVALVAAYNKADTAAKDMEKRAKATKQAFDNARQGLEDLKSSFSSYNNKQSAIDKMKEGTLEFKQAILEANTEILEMIDKYPILAQYVETINGRMKFKAGAEDAAINAQMELVNQTNKTNLATQIASKKLNQEVLEQELAREIFDTTEQLWNGARKIGAGIASTSVTGVAGYYGMFEGIKDIQNAFYAGEHGLDDFTKAVEKHGVSIMSSYESLESALDGNTSLAKAIWDNKDATTALAKNIEQNRLALKANTEQLVIASNPKAANNKDYVNYLTERAMDSDYVNQVYTKAMSDLTGGKDDGKKAGLWGLSDEDNYIMEGASWWEARTWFSQKDIWNQQQQEEIFSTIYGENWRDQIQVSQLGGKAIKMQTKDANGEWKDAESVDKSTILQQYAEMKAATDTNGDVLKKITSYQSKIKKNILLNNSEIVKAIVKDYGGETEDAASKAIEAIEEQGNNFIEIFQKYSLNYVNEGLIGYEEYQKRTKETVETLIKNDPTFEGFDEAFSSQNDEALQTYLEKFQKMGYFTNYTLEQFKKLKKESNGKITFDIEATPQPLTLKKITAETRDQYEEVGLTYDDKGLINNFSEWAKEKGVGQEKIDEILSDGYITMEELNSILDEYNNKIKESTDLLNLHQEDVKNIYGEGSLEHTVWKAFNEGQAKNIELTKDGIVLLDENGKVLEEYGVISVSSAAGISLLNETLLPLSSFPGLSSSVYDSIIKAGRAAGWSNVYINSLANAISNLNNVDVDMSTLIADLQMVAAQANTTMASLLAMQGLSSKQVYSPSGDGSYVTVITDENGKWMDSSQIKERFSRIYSDLYKNAAPEITDTSDGGDNKSKQQEAFEAEKRKYDEELAQAEADLEKGLIDEKEYRRRIEVVWANLISAYQALSSEEKEEAKDTMFQESLNIRQMVIDYFDNIYDSWMDAYDDAVHLYGSASKAAELDQAASNALKTLMGTGSIGDLKKVHDEMIASLDDESLSEEEKAYIKKRAEKVNSVITGMDSQYTDYNYLDYSNVIEDIYQSDKNTTQDEWQELYENKLNYLKDQFENKEISYKKYREEALKLINAGYFDYEKGKILPIFSKDDREDKIDELNDETFEGFDYELQKSPWKFNSDQIDATIADFSKNISDVYGIDLSSLTRESFLRLNSQDQEEIRGEIEKAFNNLNNALNNGNLSFEDYLNARKAIVEEYSAALTEGEKQMYLNEEKAAEGFAGNLKSRYDKGELTTKEYIEGIKSITTVDDYFKKNEIFAVLNSEIDKFYNRLEDGSITTLSDYMSKVKQELLDAGLWATEWGNEIWNEALSKGAGYTSSKYKAEYNNLIAQQSLVDWGMTENANNAAEYKMPYAQKWYEQEKANLDYFVENWKGTGSILDDEGYQTLLKNVQTAKDNLKELANEHLQFSKDWIAHEKSMGRLTLAEEIAAYQRTRKNLDKQFNELVLVDAEGAIEWYKKQSAELRQAEIDARKAEADQYADILKERLEDEKAYYENLKSIREKSFEASQTIREAQYELNMELQKSLTMYEYLDEETRKLIFNEEDYVALTEELSSIQTEINDLTSTYESKIASATTEEAELLTAEYEAQVELKLKEFEIAKANLEIAKKQMALQNTLNERNTRMFINGQWTWVANQEQVAKAREDLMKAEFDAETATLEYEHKQAMNQLDNAINDIQRDVNKIDKALEDLEKVINGTDGLTVTLEDLDKVVEDTIKYIKNSKKSDKVVRVGGSYLTNSEWKAVQKEASSVSNSKDQINPVTGKPYVTDKLGYAIVNGIRVKLNAKGDIVNRPTISMIGEDGPEAIIPLSQKYRDRGLSLWEEATKALGIAPSFTIPTIKALFPQEKENMNVSQTINVTVQNEDSSNDFYAITNLL